MSVLVDLQQRARALKRQTHALYLAGRDPRTPWYAKALAACTAAYALSPVDLIPDFIPVIGYLDDLVIVPAGIALAIRMIPPDVWQDCCRRAEQPLDRRAGYAAAAVIVLMWLLVLSVMVFVVIRSLRK